MIEAMCTASKETRTHDLCTTIWKEDTPGQYEKSILYFISIISFFIQE